MRAYRIAIALFALLGVLALCSPVQAATIDSSSFDKHSGTGFDFYFTDSLQVNPAEVGMLVDYSSYDLLLTIKETNQTSPYESQVVVPHSSSLIELDFPDVMSTYAIVISVQGSTVWTEQVTRPAYLLPPPQNTWSFTAPNATKNGAIYTSGDLLNAISAALASFTIQVILLVSVVVLVGAVLGATIKAITKFLVPKDILSILIYALIVLDLFFHLLPGNWSRIWDLPFLAGYLLGFMLWHIPYYETVRLDCAGKTQTVEPTVYYYPEDRASPAIMEQNNVCLIKRWLGIYHFVGTDGGLSPDWFVSMKKPYWPKVAAPALFVEKEEITAEPISIWRFKAHRFNTTLHLSNASLMPKYFWLQSSKAFFQLQDKLQRIAFELVDLRLTSKSRAIIAAADMTGHSIRVSPSETVASIFERREEKVPPITDLGERTLTVVESQNAEQQEGEIESEEPESDAAPATKQPEPDKARQKKKSKKKQEETEEE